MALRVLTLGNDAKEGSQLPAYTRQSNDMGKVLTEYAMATSMQSVHQTSGRTTLRKLEIVACLRITLFALWSLYRLGLKIVNAIVPVPHT